MISRSPGTSPDASSRTVLLSRRTLALGALPPYVDTDFDKDGDPDIFTVEMEGIPGARLPR